jgi:catechol 2,3-dioxygenase
MKGILSHIQINVKNLEKSLEFYRDIIGLIEVERDEEGVYLRGIEENRHHSIYIKESNENGLHHIGIEVLNLTDFNNLTTKLADMGIKTFNNKNRERGIISSILFEDPGRFPIEISYEGKHVKLNHLAYLTKNIKPLRLDHVTLHTPFLENVESIYKELFELIETETLVGKDGKTYAIFLTSRGYSHDLAFFRRSGPAVHHFTIRMNDLSDIIKVCDTLGLMNRSEIIELSIGRHRATGGLSVYLKDPDGNRVELFTGDYALDSTNINQLTWEEGSKMLLWGPEPPKTYYEHKTKVIDIESQKPIEF